jgi:hypothetical protein
MRLDLELHKQSVAEYAPDLHSKTKPANLYISISRSHTLQICKAQLQTESRDQGASGQGDHTSASRLISQRASNIAEVRNLERSLGTVVKDFERERNRVLSSHANFTEDLELENKGLRSVLKVTCTV